MRNMKRDDGGVCLINIQGLHVIRQICIRMESDGNSLKVSSFGLSQRPPILLYLVLVCNIFIMFITTLDVNKYQPLAVIFVAN